MYCKFLAEEDRKQDKLTVIVFVIPPKASKDINSSL